MKNLIKALPWHNSKTWSKRPIKAINELVVHQTASSSNIEEVNAYHVGLMNHISSTGCPHICYHFVIDKSGELLQVNRISDLVWHAKGHNYHSIGILVLGNFSGPGYIGTEEVSKPQLKGLSVLLTILREKYNIEKSMVVGHCEIADHKPACPGNNLLTYLNSWRKDND